MKNLKTVEEYSKEMTRKEFDRFTELEELCPINFELKNISADKCSLSACEECWNNALVGITFKESLLVLPEENMPVIEQIQNFNYVGAGLAPAPIKIKGGKYGKR